MYRNLLIFLVLLHVLGDFYFQTDAMSRKKDSEYKYVVRHSIIYAFVFFAGTAAAGTLPVLIAVLVLSLFHFAIDSIKYRYIKSHGHVSESMVYCADQCLHILSFIITAGILKYGNYTIALLPEAKNILKIFTDNGKAVLDWACIVLIIVKPANVTIKKMLSGYRPGIGWEEDGAAGKNAGAFIGTLERLIIVLMLSVNQYAAIGLVLTAKSVARYDKISKSQAFAEYYLLGTLLSTVLVILTYLLLSR